MSTGRQFLYLIYLATAVRLARRRALRRYQAMGNSSMGTPAYKASLRSGVKAITTRQKTWDQMPK